MSRRYRLIVEVDAREDAAGERSDISEAAYAFFHGLPDERADRKPGGRLVLSFEGETSLGGGQREDQAHAEIREALGGRGVRTRWWYLEGAPDHEFADPPAEEPARAS